MLFVHPAQADLASDLNALRSRLQAMGHGYYTRQEWNDVLARLDGLRERAEAQGEEETVIELSVLEAMVEGDMRRDYARAVDILEEAKERFGQLRYPVVRRIYGRLADAYAQLGDEQAVAALIEEFRHSPAYDPDYYPYSGGWGREVPLAITRPSAVAEDSVTVTSMQTHRAQAKLAPGNLFPDFEARDGQGRLVRSSDYRGRVVLLDFWVPHWHPWERALPYLKEIYRNYHPTGFDILGIYLGHDPAAAASYVESQDVPWRQILGQPSLGPRFGIYGEATNVVLDQQGVIIGRNLTGSALVEAVKGVLRD